ncbi:DUF6468 domain-containing protein [Lichenicoccus sp.]|uniref:DUF6468 domain-containing protein n=1 Tax=Lichenicoccus sp. TaxID=2781899 RepID=UPI003D14C90B
MSGMESWLEILLSGLLVMTLFHALRLERALGVLRRDRAALEQLVAGFNESTRQAEAGIERLRTVADGAGRQITRQVEQAKALKNDLSFLTERGEKLADQLDDMIRQSRPGREPEALPQANTAWARPALQAVPTEGREGDGRVRSQAEKELLRALRMAR